MSGPTKDDTPRGGLRPTNPATLVLAGVLTFAVSWYFVRQYFGAIPNVTWLAGLTMAGLAVVEAIAARTTRARVEQRPRAGRLNPLLVARFVVLAKASSLAGAIFAGAYGGVAVWALSERDRLTAAAQNLPPAVAGVVGALALVAAALLLERACRVPPPPEDEDHDGPATGPASPRR
jgi:lysylphosphatidylglycerol synthetase-like protein (DUF2156 family)